MSHYPLRCVLVVFAFMSITFGGCATTRPQPGLNQSIVEKYFAALNRRDLLALTLYVSPDVEWYSMVNGERIVEVSGREALTQMLRRYFSEHERTHWSIEHAATVERYVSVSERSQWSEGERNESRMSLGVYEIVDGRIRRIIYFLNEH
ncbi:MAG TPA: nuclear transport factor 2 family protein [Steroidobacteraceae bacterium]|nr:nuclear transport factor 2 family protein [Steroidobacteraceae bacterium]